MTTRHVVAVVHGIRTDARWAEMVRDVFSEADPNIVVRPLGYGYYNVFYFLCPFVTRGFPVREVHQKLRTLEKEHSDKQLSIIAHSFGTYIVARILAKDRLIDVYRLIFCGSVVKRRFDWTNLRRQIQLPALNECGSRDVWPVLAHRTTFGFGPTGTYGFRDPIVEDRFHQFAHTDYFDAKFVRDYWVRFIQSGEIPRTEWERTGKARVPWWIQVLARLPLRWVLLAVIAWGCYTGSQRFALGRYFGLGE